MLFDLKRKTHEEEVALLVVGEPSLVGVGRAVVTGARNLDDVGLGSDVCAKRGASVASSLCEGVKLTEDGQAVLVVGEHDLLAGVAGVGTLVDDSLGVVTDFAGISYRPSKHERELYARVVVTSVAAQANRVGGDSDTENKKSQQGSQRARSQTATNSKKQGPPPPDARWPTKDMTLSVAPLTTLWERPLPSW